MSATDLRFSSAMPAALDLRFGIESNAPDIYIDLVLEASLIAVPITGRGTIDVDIAVPRGPGSWVSDPWQAAACRSGSISVQHRRPSARNTEIDLDNQRAVRREANAGSGWRYSIRSNHIAADAWSNSAPVNIRATDDWVDLLRAIRPDGVSPWAVASRAAESISDAWITLDRKSRPALALQAERAAQIHNIIDARFQIARVLSINPGVVWQLARSARPGISAVTPPINPDDPCYTPPAGNAVALRFSMPWPGSLDLRFSCPGAPLPPATIVIPVRSYYMQANVVSLFREDTGVAIPAENLQLSIDANSWDWAWSASVPAEVRPLLISAYGSAVILLATINGMAFRLAVERVPRQREFPRASMSVSGRSRAMFLDAPYADVVTRSAGSSATAQQLMAAALTDNGASLGWEIDWQITDWVVPGDIWSHTGTAIEACQAIAAAAGGYIQAHPSEQVLSVMGRYPVAPWNWSALTPDIEIPEAACTVESDDIVDRPDYNTVFVSGRQGGILAHVTRGGTAGDRAAQMVTDALISHYEAGRQRGMAILGDTGRQRDLGISMPVLESAGIILPGTFVRYTTAEGNKIGLTRGVSIDAARPTVRQKINLEVHDDI